MQTCAHTWTCMHTFAHANKHACGHMRASTFEKIRGFAVAFENASFDCPGARHSQAIHSVVACDKWFSSPMSPNASSHCGYGNSIGNIETAICLLDKTWDSSPRVDVRGPASQGRSRTISTRVLTWILLPFAFLLSLFIFSPLLFLLLPFPASSLFLSPPLLPAPSSCFPLALQSSLLNSASPQMFVTLHLQRRRPFAIAYRLLTFYFYPCKMFNILAFEISQ